MSPTDPVDETAMIFTESDVYMIGGFLRLEWDVARSDSETAEDIEEAITAVLSSLHR